MSAEVELQLHGGVVDTIGRKKITNAINGINSFYELNKEVKIGNRKHTPGHLCSDIPEAAKGRA